eukprot:Partr_v1_DN28159_c4_g1_i5_m56098 putative glutamine amidotransferase
MHNGYISSFRQIKRKLQSLLRNDMYHFVQGNTDSEWVFALFLNQFDDPLHGSYKYEDIRQALLQTISTLNGLLKEASITETSLMNFAVTDGVSIVCTRYVNSCTSEPASLFYSSGSKFEAVTPGVFRMAKADKKQDIVIISSEPLTYERNDWITVPANSMIIITPKLNVLTFPIMDEYQTTCRNRPEKNCTPPTALMSHAKSPDAAPKQLGTAALTWG